MSISKEVEQPMEGSLVGELDEPATSPSVGGVDHARIERAVREILFAVGEDPDREGLLETPARVARMYAEVFSGLHEDPRPHLKKFFTESYNDVVLASFAKIFLKIAQTTFLPIFWGFRGGQVKIAIYSDP